MYVFMCIDFDDMDYFLDQWILTVSAVITAGECFLFQASLSQHWMV
jgi:hypothetical protein